MLRGGSCWHHAAACTCAARQVLRSDANEQPMELPADEPVGLLLRDRPPVGFRIVAELAHDGDSA